MLYYNAYRILVYTYAATQTGGPYGSEIGETLNEKMPLNMCKMHAQSIIQGPVVQSIIS